MYPLKRPDQKIELNIYAQKKECTDDADTIKKILSGEGFVENPQKSSPPRGYLWTLEQYGLYAKEDTKVWLGVWHAKRVHVFTDVRYCLTISITGKSQKGTLSKIEAVISPAKSPVGIGRREFMSFFRNGVFFGSAAGFVVQVKSLGGSAMPHLPLKKLSQSAECWWQRVQELYGIQIIGVDLSVAYDENTEAGGRLHHNFVYHKEYPRRDYGSISTYDIACTPTLYMSPHILEASKVRTESVITHEVSHILSSPFLVNANEVFREIVPTASEALLKPDLFFTLEYLTSQGILAASCNECQPQRAAFFLCLYAIRNYGLDNLKRIIRELLVNRWNYDVWEDGAPYERNIAAIDSIAKALRIPKANHSADLASAFTRANAKYLAAGASIVYIINYLEKCAINGGFLNRRTFATRFLKVCCAGGIALMVPGDLLERTVTLD